VASDTIGKQMLVLNHRTTPDCPVNWAVRMSMSIPFLWQEVIWQKEWGNYYKWRGTEKETKTDITGHSIVDGGVLSNFPIALIADKGHEDVMGDLDTSGAHKLGLLIDESLVVENCGEREIQDPKDENNHSMIFRINNLLDTMLSASDRSEIKAHEKEVCHLPAKGYGTTEFDMSPKRMNALVDGGRKAMKQYLDNLENK
jgi:predicted acylesterase/phospholipase RssA